MAPATVTSSLCRLCSVAVPAAAMEAIVNRINASKYAEDLRPTTYYNGYYALNSVHLMDGYDYDERTSTLSPVRWVDIFRCNKYNTTGR